MTDESHEPSLDAGPDPLVGQVIQDRYRIESRLGQGGMGAVYLAEHVLIQKKVAIKCLHAGLASNADVVRRFHNEAVAATAIGHPNIVDVTDMGRFDDGTFFMVLEFLKGRDWQDDLDNQGFQPIHRVAHIGVQVCDALQAACEKGIVHRDLKPENIFLIERKGDPDFVKVLDFGISKFRSGIGGSTKTGELMGTPYYMAPEQVRGAKDVTHLADIYATGVILFQALTGNVPFDAENLPELIMKIASEPAPRLESKLPHAPQQLADLLDRMLSKEPQSRPQTFAEVGAALGAFLSESSAYRPSRTMGGQEDFGATQLPSEAFSQQPAPASQIAGTPQNFAATGLAVTPDGAMGTYAPGSSEISTPLSEPREKALSDSTTSPHTITNNGGQNQQDVGEAAPLSAAKKSGSGIALIVGGIAVAAAGAFFALRSSQTNEITEAASPELIDVQIATYPSDAKLRIDGKLVSNPYAWEYERSDKKLVVDASREGYLDKTQSFSLTNKFNEVIELTIDPQAKSVPPPPAKDTAPAKKPQLKTTKKVQKKKPPAGKKPPTSTPQPAPQAAPPPAPAPAPVAPAQPAAPQPKDPFKSDAPKKIF
ncbi:MAG: serine/threonine protein kinase [Polyangiaceae bacterium]|nr:serine/threonine protein kinase [Polyangiaceae bacterium]